MPDFLPRTDSGLLGFFRNFSLTLSADPSLFRVAPDIAAELASEVDAFDAAYHIVSNHGTRSGMAVREKDAVRDRMLRLGRRIAGALRGDPSIPAAAKLSLGLRVRNGKYARIARPTTPPLLLVSQIDGSRVTLQIRNAESIHRRAKPRGVDGAMVFKWVEGEQSDVGLDERLPRLVSRPQFTITFPRDLSPGTKVYFNAQWFNPRGETSPKCPAVMARLNYPSGMDLPAPKKVA